MQVTPDDRRVKESSSLDSERQCMLILDKKIVHEIYLRDVCKDFFHTSLDE